MAAREMRERIGHLIGPRPRVCAGWHLPLGRGADPKVGGELVVQSSFTHSDTDDQERLLKQLLEAADIDTKRFTPKSLAHMIDHWKNRG